VANLDGAEDDAEAGLPVDPTHAAAAPD
jgi:hypothetical protein